MGHRHQFSISEMFENDHDENWNHLNTEQTYGHLARASSDSGSIPHPVENMFADGVHSSSHWNPITSCTVEVPHYQPDAPGPSFDPFQHSLSGRTLGNFPENFAHSASSSSNNRQAFHGSDGGLDDPTLGNGRAPYKRKSPGVPSGYERGSTSRYYSTGSSSVLPIPSELRHDKAILEVHHVPWNHTSISSSYRGNGLSIREEPMQNVRSWPAHDLESNLDGTHLSSNPVHHFYPTNPPISHSSSADLSSQSLGGSTREWNHIAVSPSHGRSLVSDTGGFNHESPPILVGSSTGSEGRHNNFISRVSCSSRSEGYHNNFIANGNSAVPQSYPSTSTQSVRGVRSSSSQRSSPSFGVSARELHSGQAGPSHEGSQVSESYGRHPRSLSNSGWHNNDRSSRSKILSKRYRTIFNEVDLRDPFSSQGYMVVDGTGFYGSRNMFDQHRNMRLDTDNMSYEELLALGERIGSVNTGLSEDLVSKCLTETIYCLSDHMQEDETCVICLEEYKDMDNVGELKSCGHDYHMNCIKKWLSMKNSCPVCKASALSDSMKEK